jgi:hypothetical protein
MMLNLSVAADCLLSLAETTVLLRSIEILKGRTAEDGAEIMMAPTLTALQQ